MENISKCLNTSCPLDEQCKRFTRQAFYWPTAESHFFTIVGNKPVCDNFLPKDDVWQPVDVDYHYWRFVTMSGGFKTDGKGTVVKMKSEISGVIFKGLNEESLNEVHRKFREIIAIVAKVNLTF